MGNCKSPASLRPGAGSPPPPQRVPDSHPPAAKCRGVDFRPAMSLALTLPASTRRFTRVTSPLRQASSSSRKAPLPAPGPGPAGCSGLSAAGLEAADDDEDEAEDEEPELLLLLLLAAGGGRGGPAAVVLSGLSGRGGRSGPPSRPPPAEGGASPSGPARLWRGAEGAAAAADRLGLRGGEAAGGEAGVGGGGGWWWCCERRVAAIFRPQPRHCGNGGSARPSLPAHRSQSRPQRAGCDVRCEEVRGERGGRWRVQRNNRGAEPFEAPPPSARNA